MTHQRRAHAATFSDAPRRLPLGFSDDQQLSQMNTLCHVYLANTTRHWQQRQTAKPNPQQPVLCRPAKGRGLVYHPFV